MDNDENLQDFVTLKETIEDQLRVLRERLGGQSIENPNDNEVSLSQFIEEPATTSHLLDLGGDINWSGILDDDEENDRRSRMAPEGGNRTDQESDSDEK